MKLLNHSGSQTKIFQYYLNLILFIFPVLAMNIVYVKIYLVLLLLRFSLFSNTGNIRTEQLPTVALRVEYCKYSRPIITTKTTTAIYFLF